MATALDAQLGFAEEVTYGTFLAPTRFLEFTDESLHLERERIESAGIRAGRRVLHRWAPGVQHVEGDFTVELAPQGAGLLWKHVLGALVTTGTNPYTHTVTPGQLDGKSLTVQKGVPDVGGVARAFSYVGCKITDWELNAAVNEYATLQCSVYGAHEDTAQALATVSYPTGLSPFTYAHGSLTIGGTATDVESISLSGSNNLNIDRHRIRATTPERPKEARETEIREYTGGMSADFEDLVAYNRFVNGTEAALVLAFNAGASAQMTITANVRFDGETPQVGGREQAMLSLPYKIISGTSDAAALTVAVVNADSAP